MRVLVVIGTRPEAIKMAPVIRALRAQGGVALRICVTAQHREMLDQALEVFSIHPDYDLGLMRKGQDLSDLTCRIISGLKAVLRTESPDMVLVHGDTTTAMAAALASFYAHIPVGHVEAGLRTGDLTKPWPEEMNRRVIDAMATLLFAPTERARQSLLSEGRSEKQILVTGNTVIDALLEINERIKLDGALKRKLDDEFNFIDKEKNLILVTGHRRENFGLPLENLCAALLEISGRNDVQILFPVHLNDSVRSVVSGLLASRRNIFLIEPQSYLPFVYLMNCSKIVITDSGGIQEEAPALGKPVLVTRDVTERPEAVEFGTATLVGTNKTRIVDTVHSLLADSVLYDRMSNAINPYGDGRASERIARRIVDDEFV